MNIYTEEAKQIYNKVCDKYKRHWLDTTVSQTMAMEMITEALSIANVSERVWTVDEIIAVLETNEDADEHAIWFDKHGR